MISARISVPLQNIKLLVMHDIITASLLPYRRMEFHEKILFKNHENMEHWVVTKVSNW